MGPYVVSCALQGDPEIGPPAEGPGGERPPRGPGEGGLPAEGPGGGRLPRGHGHRRRRLGARGGRGGGGGGRPPRGLEGVDWGLDTPKDYTKPRRTKQSPRKTIETFEILGKTQKY